MKHRRIRLYRRILWLYVKILATRLSKQAQAGKISYGEALGVLARTCVGIDVSPNDIAPDELGCAEAVSTLISLLIPFEIQTFTGYLETSIMNDDRFTMVYNMPQAGDVVISPTPFPGSQNIGHTGIFGGVGEIYSNSSADGNWRQNYTDASWSKKFVAEKQLPMIIYRLSI